VALVLACSGQAHADKLVVFHNGRTLRVENVRDEGQWLFLTLGKKSEMGVLARLIASVDDIEGDAAAQLPNVQSAAGGNSVNRGGTVGSRMTGSQRSPARQQPPMVQGGAAAAGQQEEADRARSDALSRASARATRSSKLGLVPRTIPPPGEEAVTAGTDLASTTDTSAGWRSLLDDSRSGSSSRQRDDGPRQDDEDPKR
jgi:hypothetical protein